MTYGLLATYDEPERLKEAAGRMRDLGYRRLEAFSPFAVEGIDEALGRSKRTHLPLAMLVGGIIGAVTTYGLILWSVLVDYPVDVGGRPLNAWPPFTVLAFEGGILGAALTGFFGLLWANGLPLYYHPVFNAPSFTYARGGRFWLLVESADPGFDPERTRRDLEATGPAAVEEVMP